MDLGSILTVTQTNVRAFLEAAERGCSFALMLPVLQINTVPIHYDNMGQTESLIICNSGEKITMACTQYESLKLMTALCWSNVASQMRMPIFQVEYFAASRMTGIETALR